jgi:alkanesulfonate monooxygenase SsuD/methylene tetrahydromethanopterin reductase-like flavin-dependent oxidoreductase (luciferase family)
MPKRRVLPKPLQSPHPPIWGATSSEEGHRQIGALGLGLCSFAVGVPPEEVKKKIDVYRAAIATCRAPLGRWIHDRAATFTMTLCAPTREEAHDVARESFEWYPKAGARLIGSLAEWMAETGRDLGNYAYAGDLRNIDKAGALDLMTLDYLTGAGACALGTPADCLDACKRYEAAGVDQLLCLVNPYKIPHDKAMQTIELMGAHVLPHFRQ